MARHFTETLKIDIINDPIFASANTMYKAVCVDLQKEGLGVTDHTHSIAPEDLKKLYFGGGPDHKKHNVLDTGIPSGLQQKVFFDLLYFLCRRGRQNIKLFKKDTFAVAVMDHVCSHIYTYCHCM